MYSTPPEGIQSHPIPNPIHLLYHHGATSICDGVFDHTGKDTLSSLRKDIKFHKRNGEQADTKPLRRILNPWG